MFHFFHLFFQFLLFSQNLFNYVSSKSPSVILNYFYLMGSLSKFWLNPNACFLFYELYLHFFQIEYLSKVILTWRSDFPVDHSKFIKEPFFHPFKFLNHQLKDHKYIAQSLLVKTQYIWLIIFNHIHFWYLVLSPLKMEYVWLISLLFSIWSESNDHCLLID